MFKPLKGIRVIDLSKVLAGPLCAQSLGDMGADVIKVEPPGVGDDTRAWLPKKNGESATFMSVNHNKRSLALDLKSEAGQKVLHKLVADADVVIQGFGAGTAERLKVDAKTLQALNPRLVYCEISGYGRDGPLGKEPGYDVMLQAFGGLISTIGQPDGEYARVSFSPVDLGTGMHATSGILGALLHQQRTGEGAYVEVSLLDTAVGFMVYMAHNHWASDKVPKPMGTAHPSLCPYKMFKTADGHVMLGVANDRAWRRFCEVAGMQAHVDDPRFVTNADRVTNFEQTNELVATYMVNDTSENWIRKLRDAGVPIAPIHTLDQALSNEQVLARQIVTSHPHPTVGDLKHVSYPVTFNHDQRGPVSVPPLLGEHSVQVLAQAGFSEEQINTLIEQGVVQHVGDRTA
ncbi:CaiB/BaiF CoA transferase family protein [Orrella marina]|uniref:Formyl-CoA transferase n=1 Tax=Orrella marina TaxID=2163011 RepID=A0A2R4XP37_9BURK|nr:CaiB/BaiF CoA-transferase family protein [Orrella marina]AWB35551.1 formyl-CoA transferase [Orrella marina]